MQLSDGQGLQEVQLPDGQEQQGVQLPDGQEQQGVQVQQGSLEKGGDEASGNGEYIVQLLCLSTYTVYTLLKLIRVKTIGLI